jgi:hypothetical protein
MQDSLAGSFRPLQAGFISTYDIPIAFEWIHILSAQLLDNPTLEERHLFLPWVGWLAGFLNFGVMAVSYWILTLGDE